MPTKRRERIPALRLLRQLDEEEPKGGGHGRTARATVAPVTQAYRDWLKSECGGVELLGMRLRHGQAVRLNHIYVPVTTRSGYLMAKMGDPAGLVASRRRELAERPQLVLGALEHVSLYLSGTPGSGKSTFCRWVTWLVSEDAMPASEVDPPQEYAEQFPEALRGRLPVLVRLRDFWRFLPRLPSGSDLCGLELEQALVRWLASRQPKGLAAEELHAQLERGTALLILDGVDEVPVSADGDKASWAPRSLLVSGLKHGCPDWTKKGNRILLTSRPYGLTTGDTPQGLSPMPIESLPAELQTLLVQRWFRVLADTKETGQTTARDMQAHLAEHRWLEPLTANPLLLTAMCIIYDEGKRLPQDKHDLYDRIIDTVLHGRYREPVAKDAARNRLGVIAHGMHTGEGLGEARTTPQAEATYAEIERMLKTYQARSPWTEAGYLGAVETREELLSNSGLLLSSGEKRAQFYHLSFQEFLAAQRILDLTDRSLLDVFRERAPAPEWRNTLSLLFGRVLGTSVSPAKGISLMREMIDAIRPKAVDLPLVVTECIETLRAKGIRLPKDQESRLQQIFLRAMRSDEPAGDRASLGNMLARLGDPRFHVDAWYLPDEPLLGFVEIPEGPFLMGKKKGDSLPRYYIARYPVTVAQFQAFVQDSCDQP